MIPIDSRALVRLVRQVVDDALAKAFGGSPGVYHNASLTIDRTGAVRWAAGGGEVAFDFGTAGTIHYVAPYRMVMGTAVTAASAGTATTFSYGVAPGTAPTTFASTAPPFTLGQGDILRVAATGVAGTPAYAAVTFARDFAGTVGL